MQNEKSYSALEAENVVLKEKILFMEMKLNLLPCLLFMGVIPVAGHADSLCLTDPNRPAELALGYSRNELEAMKTKGFSTIIHHEDMHFIDEAVSQFDSKGFTDTHRAGVRMLSENGEMLRVLLECSLLSLHADGSTHRFQCSGNIITDKELDHGWLPEWQKELLRKKHSIITDSISQREREVIKLLLSGKTEKQTADVLFISVRTVGKHRENIYVKLEVKNIKELICKAVQYGLD
jgi:DNA-binding CsgD family transcriptional regulator